MVLVVGATGHLGRSICEQLAQQGKEVRAVVRPSSPPEQVNALRTLGAQLVQADLKDAASLLAACQGMDVVISTATTTLRDPTKDSIPDVDHQGGLNLVEAARQSGVGHFVYVSFPEFYDGARPSPLSQAKRAVERELQHGEMPFTILQPGVFMEVWLSPALGFDPLNARARVLGSGEAPIGWISLHDVARAAVACLDHPDLRGATLPLVAENRSVREVVGLFEQIGGRTFELEHVPVEALETQVTAANSPLEQSFAALMLTLAQGVPITPDPRQDALCPAPTTLPEYAHQVAAPSPLETPRRGGQKAHP
ncbi:SDR family oxidoreductase [Deinococcus aerophilus]|uniref:NmrA family transcriptional regulator n=1 Tax=Deinococcus aerophilus TaxID=522488 RepID=A0ABQ2GYC7_9DEIO|nr:SDR family oxidoreductase [Deinococcus aerophilus]GGM18216.1 NmrA family transcriptional regulator [Deinococcus aerophilus]